LSIDNFASTRLASRRSALRLARARRRCSSVALRVLGRALIVFNFGDLLEFSQPTAHHIAAQFGKFFFDGWLSLATDPVEQTFCAKHGFSASCEILGRDHQVVIDAWSKQFVKELLESILPTAE